MARCKFPNRSAQYRACSSDRLSRGPVEALRILGVVDVDAEADVTVRDRNIFFAGVLGTGGLR